MRIDQFIHGELDGASVYNIGTMLEDEKFSVNLRFGDVVVAFSTADKLLAQDVRDGIARALEAKKQRQEASAKMRALAEEIAT